MSILRYCIFFILIIKCPLSSFSQEQKSYGKEFFKAKALLAYGQANEALEIFLELLKANPENANINYLTGVCYTEQKKPDTKAIEYLEKAIENINIDYDPGSHEEHLAPVFVHYYLVIAYSKNGECYKAKQANDMFMKLYGRDEHDFYIQDAKRWITECNADRLSKIETDTTQIKSKIVTKDVYFFTPSPLYGVQVGAYSRLTPVNHFENLKNVTAYLDFDGRIVRYVIGLFSHRFQAEALRNVVRQAGHYDAFVVDVNEATKYAQEIVSIDDISVKHQIEGRIDFSVQIGAFTDSIPSYLLFLYLQVERIKETKEGNLNVLTTGLFSTYEEAEAYRNDLLHLGIPGAFIVAYNYNKKVTVKQALSYLKKN